MPNLKSFKTETREAINSATLGFSSSDYRTIKNLVHSRIDKLVELLEKEVEDIIQKERFAGAPYALNKVIAKIKEIK